MSMITLVGVSLSAAAFVLLGLVLRDWNRRRRDGAAWPPGMRSSLLRWSWPPALAVSFLLGFWGTPVVERTSTTAGPDASAAENPAAIFRSTLRLPFYLRSEVRALDFDGVHLGSATTRTALHLPWAFLAVGTVYWMSVIRRRRVPAARSARENGE